MSQFKLAEESELPLNLEDLPNINNQEQEVQIPTGTDLEVATKFVQELQKLLKQKNKKEELLHLSDIVFNKLSETQFKNTQWPSPEDIEESGDIEVEYLTQKFYLELSYRHCYSRLSNNLTADIRRDSWLNYQELFEMIQSNKDDINLPVQWIWDIYDEFIYQFQNNCQWRARAKEEDPQVKQIIQNNESFWNLEQTFRILNDTIKESKIVKKNEQELEDIPNQQDIKNLQLFGYFAIVSKLRINVLIGAYEDALESISKIDFKKLTIFSKAYACYISLFYYIGFAYLMVGKQHQTVKIYEALLSYINKYKQFYSKSYQYDAMNKQADRILCLVAIALVFCQVQVEDNILQNIKDRLQNDFELLNKYDQATFIEYFNYGNPKFITPIKTLESFSTMPYEQNPQLVIQAQREKLLRDFNEVQNINNISSILKLYSRISVQKAAKVLKISTEQLQELLKQYQERSNIQFNNTPFEQTVVKRFISNSSQIDFTLTSNDIIEVKEVSASLNYQKLFNRYSQKIEDMINELESFDEKYLYVK